MCWLCFVLHRKAVELDAVGVCICQFPLYGQKTFFCIGAVNLNAGCVDKDCFCPQLVGIPVAVCADSDVCLIAVWEDGGEECDEVRSVFFMNLGFVQGFQVGFQFLQGLFSDEQVSGVAV